MGVRRFGARLSDAAADGWEHWAAAQGLTVSALLEAIGCELAEGTTELSWKTIKRAQQIQADRKRRR